MSADGERNGTVAGDAAADGGATLFHALVAGYAWPLQAWGGKADIVLARIQAIMAPRVPFMAES
ncbi:MAG: hypothetical protein P4L86_19335 [Mycobacterium sp.]|nr:hypothetical protein [Mycobacterium sp.]